MPLVINGYLVDNIPQDSSSLFSIYPSLKDSGRNLISQAHKVIGPIGSIYVGQRELAVVTPMDKSISLIGSDDATTCSIVTLRHCGSGVVGLGHFDGCGLEQGVSDLVRQVSETSAGYQGDLELHLVGGFCDNNGYSSQLLINLLYAFHRQMYNINLLTCCVCDMNNTYQGSMNRPIVYGVGVNVKTGEMFPATFQDKGPDFALRGTRLFSDTTYDMLNIYDTVNQMMQIGPFNYQPMRSAELWLKGTDELILRNLSTSPEVEPAHFAENVRNTIAFIHKNPFPSVTVFPNNRPRYYQKDEFGQWHAI